MGGPQAAGGLSGPGQIIIGETQVSPFDVTITNPTPGTRALEAAQGQTYPAPVLGNPRTYRGVQQALQDTVRRGLGDVPLQMATGRVKVTFTIGTDGHISSVNCSALGEHGEQTISMRSKTDEFGHFVLDANGLEQPIPFRELANAIASTLANATFEPPQPPGSTPTVSVPLEFGVVH